MKKLDSFSVRAYAICFQNNKVLAVEEVFEDVVYCKLPGGGVEFGEGLRESLGREFMEKLNLKIEVTAHHYTQENFVHYISDGGTQQLLIYYLANILNIEDLAISSPDIVGVKWIDLDEP